MKKLMVICSIALLFGTGAGTGVMNIHRIGIFESNAFLLETDTSLFLIDAGYPGREERILKKIREINKKLALIIITHGHFDHYGCAAAVKRATGAKIAVYELDAEYLCRGTTPLDSVNFIGFFGRLILPLAEKIFKPDTMCPDILMKDGDSLDQYGLRATILYTPGHTKGSCSVIVQDSIAFVGDLLTNSPVFRKQHYYASSWKQIDESLKKLLTRRFTIVYIGHYGKTTDRKSIEKIAGK
jgi:hydroxyacylglutathione hydrolase